MNPAPVTSRIHGIGLFVLAASLLLFLPARSSITQRLPDGNTGNAATAMPAILEKTNKVRIDYADNMSVLITDDAWISRLKKLLGDTGYKPTPYCFCFTPGGFILLADDSELARFTVPHGIKLRFLGSKSLHGDFLIEKAAAGAILALAREKQSLAVAQSRFIPPQPVLPEKLEYRP
jgi:hypothetical protein